jgi:hypothetical protein
MTTDDPESTSGLEELPLRLLQLREIRAMLALPPNATHEAVISRIAEIGQAVGQIVGKINTSAIPRRYR